jgi:acetyl esterase
VFGSSIGSLGLIRRIVAQTHRPVVSLDYPLSPEHPYPEAINRVTRALAEMETAGVIGGSAGAQIALHAVSRLEDAGPRAGLLFCGAFSQNTDTWSHCAFGNDTGQLTTERMERYLAAYGMPKDAPLPNLANIPPLFLSVGDSDPLLDDSLQVHASAQSFNGSVLEVIPHAHHGFMNDWYKNHRIDRAVSDALDWLENICTTME